MSPNRNVFSWKWNLVIESRWLHVQYLSSTKSTHCLLLCFCLIFVFKQNFQPLLKPSEVRVLICFITSLILANLTFNKNGYSLLSSHCRLASKSWLRIWRVYCQKNWKKVLDSWNLWQIIRNILAWSLKSTCISPSFWVKTLLIEDNH